MTINRFVTYGLCFFTFFTRRHICYAF